MASEQITIRQWAEQLGVPQNMLLKGLIAIGWQKSSSEDMVSAAERSNKKVVVLAMRAAKAQAIAAAAADSAAPLASQPRPAGASDELRRFAQTTEEAKKSEQRRLDEAAEQNRIRIEERDRKRAQKLEEERKAAAPPTIPTAGDPDRRSQTGRRPTSERGRPLRRQQRSGRRRRSPVVEVFERELQSDGTLVQKGQELEQQFQSRPVKVPETIQVTALAHSMSVKASTVVGVLREMGEVVSASQVIDQDTACLVVEEIGHTAVPVADTAVESRLQEYLKADGPLTPRSPVVTVMGHIDHGKTTLLDCIRKSSVAASEKAGITQHIGAYQVQVQSGTVTFIDTPGHAAFTSLRARGAQVTDLIVLVVAGDDGVMPQTREAIDHAKAAEVPIVVAINKMDKPQADPDRIKEDLAVLGVQAEGWGGDVQMVPVSATTGKGVDKLLEALLLEAEVREFRAAAEAPTCGIVLESSMSVGRGPAATLLIQQGRLKVGDPLLADTIKGKVRAMFASDGRPIRQAEVSMPVEVLGFPSVPDVGNQFAAIGDEQLMRKVMEYRVNAKQQRKAVKEKVSLNQIFNSGAEKKQLSLVVKADAQGSMEAIAQALAGIGDDTASIRLVAGGVGGLAESDIHLTHTVGGIALGFNVRADAEAKRASAAQGVEIRYYSTIYELIEDVEKALLGILGPELREQIVGVAEVKEVFTSSKFGQIAGCTVVEGAVQRDKPVRVLRGNVVIFEGRLSSLRRFKDDVQEVRNGTECGIGIEKYRDIRPNDRIEIFSAQEVQRVFKDNDAQQAAARQ